jgi:hypothetical protein
MLLKLISAYVINEINYFDQIVDGRIFYSLNEILQVYWFGTCENTQSIVFLVKGGSN